MSNDFMSLKWRKKMKNIEKTRQRWRKDAKKTNQCRYREEKVRERKKLRNIDRKLTGGGKNIEREIFRTKKKQNQKEMKVNCVSSRAKGNSIRGKNSFNHKITRGCHYSPKKMFMFIFSPQKCCFYFVKFEWAREKKRLIDFRLRLNVLSEIHTWKLCFDILCCARDCQNVLIEFFLLIKWGNWADDFIFHFFIFLDWKTILF